MRAVVDNPALLSLTGESPVRVRRWAWLIGSVVASLAGLLLALGAHGTVPWRAWDWGTAAALPWLPRVRTGRAILAPARWALPPGLLYLARAGTGRQWRDGHRRGEGREGLECARCI